MRELSIKEVEAVSGGSFIDLETAVIGGGVAGAASQMAKGARMGLVLGPKGAVGGAVIGGLAYSVTHVYRSFRQ